MEYLLNKATGHKNPSCICAACLREVAQRICAQAPELALAWDFHLEIGPTIHKLMTFHPGNACFDLSFAEFFLPVHTQDANGRRKTRRVPLTTAQFFFWLGHGITLRERLTAFNSAMTSWVCPYLMLAGILVWWALSMPWIFVLALFVTAVHIYVRFIHEAYICLWFFEFWERYPYGWRDWLMKRTTSSSSFFSLQ